MSQMAGASVSDSDSLELHFEKRGVAELWLTLLTLAVYGLSLTCGFVYDDRVTVQPGTAGQSWSNVISYFTTNLSFEHNSNFYRPFVITYIGAMNSICGSSAFGWHLASLLLHLICVLLVFAFAKRLLHSGSTAFIAAALFAVHPTHVEAVTWISAAGEPLMTIFILSAALAFLNWRAGKSPAWLALSIAAAMGALLCKETAVVTPALISALVLLPAATAARSLRAQLAATAAFWIEAFAFLHTRTHVLHGFSHPFTGASNTDMVLSWPAAIVFYVRDMFFPVGMSPVYPFTFVHSPAASGFIFPLLAVILLAAAVIWFLRQSAEWRLYLTCLVWIAAPLAPVMYLKLFPPFELVHDRYLYISTIGLSIAAAAAITSLVSRAESLGIARLRGLTAALLIGVSAAATIGYESWWQSDVTLFKRALTVTPNNETVLTDLGVALMEHKQYQAGIGYLDQALQLDPNNSDAIFNRGRAAWEMGDNALALRCFERSLQLSPQPARWIYLASVDLRLGKPADAEFAARQALSLDPNAPNTHLAIGAALQAQGNKPAAIAEFEEEQRQHPDSQGARQMLQQARSQKLDNEFKP